MPEFTYSALSKIGKRDTGTVTATSEREAASMLDARGLLPVQIKAIKSKGQARFGRKVKGRVVATFYAQLADLIHSGVPLLRALKVQHRNRPELSAADRAKLVNVFTEDIRLLEAETGTSFEDWLGYRTGGAYSVRKS